MFDDAALCCFWSACNVRRRRVGRRLRRVELLPGDDLLGHQLLGPREVGLRLGQVGLGRADLRLQRRALVGRGLHRRLGLPLALAA